MDKSSISETIIAMATERGADKSICPSEVARALFDTHWRNHMDDVRVAAIDLQQQGKVAINQNNEPVDVKNIHGLSASKLYSGF